MSTYEAVKGMLIGSRGSYRVQIELVDEVSKRVCSRWSSVVSMAMDGCMKNVPSKSGWAGF